MHNTYQKNEKRTLDDDKNDERLKSKKKILGSRQWIFFINSVFPLKLSPIILKIKERKKNFTANSHSTNKKRKKVKK